MHTYRVRIAHQTIPHYCHETQAPNALTAVAKVAATYAALYGTAPNIIAVDLIH